MPGCSHDRRIHFFTAEQQSRKNDDQHGQQPRVELHAERIVQRFVSGNAILRSISDEAFGAANLFHHVVAGVYAGGTAHAFHLGTVTDIDARGTYFYALQAIDAISEVAIFFFSVFSARFAPLVVIGNDHGVAVEQYALQTAIGADDGAGLLPEESIHGIKDAGEDEQGRETAKMPVDGFGDDLTQFANADDIGKEGVGDEKGDQEEDQVFCSRPKHPIDRPRAAAGKLLLRRISENDIFHFAEEHLHEDGLGADPAAEKTAEGRGEQDDEDDKGHHRQAKDKKVLRPEDLPEKDETGVGNIEQEKRLTMDIDKGQGKKEQEKAQADVGPEAVPFPRRLLREDPFTAPAGVDGSQVIPEALVGYDGCFHV